MLSAKSARSAHKVLLNSIRESMCKDFVKGGSSTCCQVIL